MKKEINVYLHIGLHKTGTTAIQRYAFENREKLLKDHGILYPRSGLPEKEKHGHEGHHKLALSFYGYSHPEMRTYFNAFDSNDIIDQFIKEMCEFENKFERIFISSEYLYVPLIYNKDLLIIDEFKKAFSKLSVEPIFFIVITLRRQDDLIESAYKQAVLSERVSGYILDYFNHSRKDYLFYEQLSGFLYGLNDNLFVQFIPVIYNKNIVDTFFYSVFDIEIPYASNNKYNESISALNTLMLRKLNEQLFFEDPAYIKRFILDLEKTRNNFNYGLKYLLSLEERKSIIKYYEDSNKNLISKYLKDKRDNGKELFLGVDEELSFKEHDKIVRINREFIDSEVEYRLLLLKEHVLKTKTAEPKKYLVDRYGYRGLHGEIEKINQEGIYGFILDVNSSTESEIAIYIEGKFVYETKANIYAKDIAERFGINFASIFFIPWREMHFTSELMEYLILHKKDNLLNIQIFEKKSGFSIKIPEELLITVTQFFQFVSNLFMIEKEIPLLTGKILKGFILGSEDYISEFTQNKDTLFIERKLIINDIHYIKFLLY